MKPHIGSLLLVLLLPGLTGCWDQRELKEIRIEDAEAFDLLENGKILFSISVPTIKLKKQAQSEVAVPILGAEGRTINEAYAEIKKTASQNLDFGKTRLILINKRLAQKSLYPALESYYREAHSPINVKMAIVDDSASKLLHLKAKDRLMVSEYVYELLQSGEDNGLIPKASPFLIYSMFTNHGTDATIPIVNPIGVDRAKISGLALFHNKQMTGELDSNASMSLIMLSKSKPDYFTITEKDNSSNMIVSLFMNRDGNRKIAVSNDKDSLRAVISADFTCDLVEVPDNIHFDDEMLKKLGSQLEQKLSERAKEVIKELQHANCDALGIGLEVKAHHYHYWKAIQWDKVYPGMSIEPKITINIVKRGLLE
ncbi:hypothetical protein PAECIP111891_05977 [Paenibacillus allorhizoplanae]|uniref:Ger(X)C family spore germination protein n=1 Tax=Paenibacillus allorhizoplanae TaxID=2905648 RepID=A0ABN8H407_9BACL|nr:Ger(x)C family spore germination protein [Paenibacillus allorhizoplanae]CAH1226701.1 hypothetical protein PAECIP111891_05977 [Paenibacillus allorhizoplanae]